MAGARRRLTKLRASDSLKSYQDDLPKSWHLKPQSQALLASIKRGIIMHQVNCKNSMSKGLARSLYEAHPEIKSEYHRAFVCYEPEQLFGKYQLVRLSENLIVMNSFSQFGFRSKPNDKAKYTDEAALKRNLKNLAKLGLKMNLPIYVPDKIGCSEGGNWQEIKEFLEALKPDITLVKSPEISK